ncbi:TetR/AcrR family transcriptional regulator [Longispora sp. NPDC051575]|uniref:TetR/AcrR family transcriptional regulator n=1 Tax=Longispora sp. NPDC051575 TaxID=3154943 RepID=UPI003443D72A
MESGVTQPPIGRGPKVRAAVLAATLTELAEVGYAALTVDNVARRAGVHKTTVYRRWADRETLIADALTERVAADIPLPDTGAIDTDLRELARNLTARMTGRIGRIVLTTMLSDAPEITEARRRIFADRILRAAPLVERAVRRGELPADTDPVELIRALAAPIYLRLVVTGEPLTTAAADRAAAAALAAARAGVFVP